MNQNSEKMRTETEDRLANLAVRVIRALETVVVSGQNAHVVELVLRSSVAAYVVHGDRGGSSSFLQHLKDCLQDLVVTRRGLMLIRRLEWIAPSGLLDELVEEADILVRIYASSVRTVESRQGGGFNGGGARSAPLEEMDPNWPEDPKPAAPAPTMALTNGGGASRNRRVGR